MTDKEWRSKFKNRLIEFDINKSLAAECAERTEVLSDVEPDEAADDEYSYWIDELS